MLRGLRGKIGLAAMIVLLVLAAPAAAGTDDLGTVGGIDYRARSNPSPLPAPGASVGPDAECLEGDRLVGGGVAIGGDSPESVINRSSGGDQDFASPQSWATIWANLSGAPKSATVTSACMDRDVKRVRKTKPVQGGTAKGLKASCPPGTHVASGGGFIEGGQSHQLPELLLPDR